MAMVKVYDKDGKEYEKEPVDAKECVAVMGWTMTPKTAEELAADGEVRKAAAAVMTEEKTPADIEKATKRAYNKKG